MACFTLAAFPIGDFEMRRIVLSLCLLLSPALAQAANVAGLWVGYYAYDP